jgi:hypothetical protein
MKSKRIGFITVLTIASLSCMLFTAPQSDSDIQAQIDGTMAVIREQTNVSELNYFSIATFTRVPIITTTPTREIIITITPTLIPSNPESHDDLGEWIVVVAGGVNSFQGGWNYGKKFVNVGYTVQVFETDNNNIRVAVVGFSSEEEANKELPKIQTLNPLAYIRKLSEWCPDRKYFSDHILCR